MTSFAFILGLLPLVIAQGVGALTRQSRLQRDALVYEGTVTLIGNLQAK